MNSLGTARERQVRRHLEEDGWVVIRAAGSLGPVDLVAMRRGQFPRFVQVKTDDRRPFDHFRPPDRLKLTQLARQAGAEAWLAWWPPRRTLQWLAESQWPTIHPRIEIPI